MRYFELLIIFTVLLLSLFSILNTYFSFVKLYNNKVLLIKEFFINRKYVYYFTENDFNLLKERARYHIIIDFLNGTKIEVGNSGIPMIYSIRYVDVNGSLAKVIIGTW